MGGRTDRGIERGIERGHSQLIGAEGGEDGLCRHSPGAVLLRTGHLS